MIDIGINIVSSQFEEDRAEVIKDAWTAGLSACVLTGTSVESSVASLNWANRDSRLFSTAGVHPHNANKWSPACTTLLRELVDHPKVLAVGETGLDYFRSLSTPEQQKVAFEAQLSLALAVKKPCFLHCRDAFNDFFPLITEFCKAGGTGVVHCFTGTKNEATAYLDHGLDIGITGWVCDNRRNKSLLEAIPVIPLNRLHVETDAPYLLAPLLSKALGTRRNEPRFLPYVAAEVARMKNVSIDRLVEQTTKNFHKLFNPTGTYPV